MKLRSRLALTAASTLLPVIVALFWVDAAAQHRVAKERLVQFVNSRMSNGRDACEAAPEQWGGVHGGNPPSEMRPPIERRPPNDRRRIPMPPGFPSKDAEGNRPPPPPNGPPP